MKKTLIFPLACVALLSACAGVSTRDGLVYRDGSWYSPGVDGRGDYYTGMTRRDEAYDWPWGYSVGIVPFGGYCPVRYRYCMLAWDSPAWYWSWHGDPYWYSRSVHHHRPLRPLHAPRRNIADGRRADLDPVIEPRVDRPQPRPWVERSAPRPEGGARPRSRTRDVLSGGGSN